MSNTFKPLCPHCSTRARVRSCERWTNTYTWIYCLCANCGAVWGGAVEALNFVNPPMRAATGKAVVPGNYEFNEAGVLVPVSTEVKTIRTRAEPEVDPRQLTLEMPAPA